MTREPTMENVDKMAANPKIRLMAGTGGMGMVLSLIHIFLFANVVLRLIPGIGGFKWYMESSQLSLIHISCARALLRRKSSSLF